MLDPSGGQQVDRHLCALAIMTKAPRPGHVKTRLVPPLTPDQAAELNKCFLRDTATAIIEAAGENARGVAVYTPAGTEAAYRDILPAEFFLIPQRGEHFGDRLRFAAEDLFKCGFESVCLIDSDSPTVPASTYRQATEFLASAGDRIVLGPSDDGGYFLIGLKKLHPELFEQIDWSTERVFDQTLQRAALMELETKLLSSGYDVDDRAGLEQLKAELLGQGVASDLAPHTREFLSRL